MSDPQNWGTPQAAPAGGQSRKSDWMPAAEPPWRNSGLGIASFVLAVVSVVVTMGFFVAAGYLKHAMGANYTEKSPAVQLIGLGILAAMGGELLAFALGVAAMFMAERKKTLGILGIVLSALFGVGTLGLIVLGLAIKSMQQ